MMRRAYKLATASALVAAIAAGAWDYTAPARTIQALRSAALNHDAEALNSYIDFAALRENLNAQFAARLMENSTANPGSNLGSAATRLQSVKAMVDSLISPQAIQVDMDRVNGLSQLQGRNGSFGFLPVRRDSFDRFHLPLDPGDNIAVRFERRGFAWKVTDLKLPYDLKAAFARSPSTTPEDIDNPE